MKLVSVLSSESWGVERVAKQDALRPRRFQYSQASRGGWNTHRQLHGRPFPVFQYSQASRGGWNGKVSPRSRRGRVVSVLSSESWGVEPLAHIPPSSTGGFQYSQASRGGWNFHAVRLCCTFFVICAALRPGEAVWRGVFQGAGKRERRRQGRWAQIVFCQVSPAFLRR